MQEFHSVTAPCDRPCLQEVRFSYSGGRYNLDGPVKMIILKKELKFGWLLMLSIVSLLAQSSGILTTFAGTQWSFPTGKIEARQAPLGRVEGMALHPDGSVYLADPENHLVLRYDRQTGLIERIAGGITGFCGDGGPAIRACLSSPMAVAIDRQGQIYIADWGNSRIRLIDRVGTIRTVLFQSAPSLQPVALALDGQGRLLISSGADTFPGTGSKPRILRLDGDLVEVVAGNGEEIGPTPDGAIAATSSLTRILDIAVDSRGVLYFLEEVLISGVRSARLRRVSANGRLETVAGGSARGFPRDGQPAVSEGLVQPLSIAIDNEDRPVIADLGLIYRVEKNGLIRWIVGSGRWSLSQPQDSVEAKSAVLHPNLVSLVVEPDGSYLWGEQHITRLSNNLVQILAGSQNFRRTPRPVPATTAVLRSPRDLALGRDGEVFVADGEDIYKISLDGVLTPFVQQRSVQREVTRVGDQLPLSELYINPNSIATTRSGDFFFTLPRRGVYQLLNGGYAQLVSNLVVPSQLREGPDGNLYFSANTGTSLLRFDRKTGSTAVVAGTNESAQSQDGVPIASARFGFVYGIAFNAAGETILSDVRSHRIWRLTNNGRLALVGGNGSSASAEVLGNGQLATQSAIPSPQGIYQEEDGALLVTYIYGLLRIQPNGVIEHLIGPRYSSSGDGRLAKDGFVSGASAVIKDGRGNIYINDQGNKAIRVILATPPTGSVSSKLVELNASAGSTISEPVDLLVQNPVPSVRFQIDAPAGGLPDWLRLSTRQGVTPLRIAVSADAGRLTAGSYESQFTVRFPDLAQPPIPVLVRLQVSPAREPKLVFSEDRLSLAVPLAPRLLERRLKIINTGNGKASYRVQAALSGAGWLSVTPTSGEVNGAEPKDLLVAVDARELASGVFSTELILETNGQVTSRVPVNLAISDRESTLSISQIGLSFLAVQGGGVVPPQEIGILSQGANGIGWNLRQETLTGGEWLRSGTGTGRTGSDVPTVPVTVDPLSNPPGDYYGLLRVESPAAANSPQLVTVSMRVLPENSNAGTVVQPAGLRFHSGPARERPGHQEVVVYNVSGGALSFQARTASVTAGQTIAMLPEAGVIRPEMPFRMLILHSGDRAGIAVINLQLSDGNVVPIRSEFVPAPQAPAKQTSYRLIETDACRASKLVPSVVSLGQGNPAIGWPTAMVLDIKDDCGASWANGSVVALFSNGDPPVELKSLENGRWHGTWSPRFGVGKDVVVQFQAKDRNGSIEGVHEARTGLLGQQAPPVVSPSGVVSPIDSKAFEPLALGSLIRLDGERLAETPQRQQDGTSWTGQLGSTRVFIAGRPVALGSVSGTRIDGVLPFDIEPNTTHQLVVLRGNTYSLPVTVDVARATPNLLSNPQSGDNWAAVSARSGPDQSFNLAGPDNPPAPGDEVLLLAVGLGPTLSPVLPGAVGSEPNPVETEIAVVTGNRTIPASASLAPGIIGLYSVVFHAPVDLDTSSTEIAIEAAGRKSAVRKLTWRPAP